MWYVDTSFRDTVPRPAAARRPGRREREQAPPTRRQPRFLSHALTKEPIGKGEKKSHLCHRSEGRRKGVGVTRIPLCHTASWQQRMATPRDCSMSSSMSSNSGGSSRRAKSRRGQSNPRMSSRSAIVACLVLATCGTSTAFRFLPPGSNSILRSGSSSGRNPVSRRSAASGVRSSHWAGGGRVVTSSKPVSQQRRCVFVLVCVRGVLQLGDRSPDRRFTASFVRQE